MSEKPIIILGAGATAACGGPLTDQILPAALNGKMAHDDQNTLVEDRELGLTREFLGDCFNVPLQAGRFRTLFGDGIDWHTTGFAGWLTEQKHAKAFPFSQN